MVRSREGTDLCVWMGVGVGVGVCTCRYGYTSTIVCR